MKGRGYSFETLRGRSLYRKTNLQSIIDSNGLYIGPHILAQAPCSPPKPSTRTSPKRTTTGSRSPNPTTR